MTINFYRLPGEDAAHPEKENATAGNRGAAGKANQTDPHSTRETSRETERERGVFQPLLWAELGREVKPAKFRGKHKRAARQAVINAKRMGGNITAELAGLILLALVAGALLMGGA